MDHKIYKVADFKSAGPYTLEVYFDDGSSRLINFLPVLRGELFGPLADVNLFNRVTLDTEVNTLVWPNGADFDPATLHDWPADPSVALAATAHWEKSSSASIEATPKICT